MAAAGMPAVSVPFWEHFDFTCPICRDQFTRHKELPCKHTFCQHCLQKVAGSSQDFPCSLCRQRVELIPGGVSQLPDKYFEDALDVFKTYGLPMLRTGPIQEFSNPFSIALSETAHAQRCFVANYNQQNIQVLLFSGASVRHFPTIVPALPGEDGQRIYPEDMAMDGEGNLWVVGSLDQGAAGPGFAVQYNQDGHVMRHFELPRSQYIRGVAVDTGRNVILVTHRGGNIHGLTGAVHVYSPDGTLVKTVEQEGMEFPTCITVDGEGRILVTDDDSHSVYVYSHDGQFLFQFEFLRQMHDQDHCGICTDSSGNIIVVYHENDHMHVEMFNRFGKFRRSITIGMKGPQAVAISTRGHLVVADNVNNELTFLTVDMFV